MKNIENYILPFEGRWYVLNGGTTPETSHGWDNPFLKYAYDFLIMDKKDKTFKGDYSVPENYYCYEKNIIAPADGVIKFTESNCIDSTIKGNDIISCDCGRQWGNYIIIKHHFNNHSAILHLMKDSLLVEPNEEVKQGQVIAKVGNSGLSSEPHIHFSFGTVKESIGGFSFYSISQQFGNIVIHDNPELNKLEQKYITNGQFVQNKRLVKYR